jgi:dissimilatory sulfite reductase (desulfoviridin) alpha/beta subunit
MDMPKEKEVVEVLTCRAGEGGCPMSVIDVKVVAGELARVIADPDLRQKLEVRLKKQFNFHSQFCAVVTGCPNACAQPQIRDFGVTGRARIGLDETLCTECGMCDDACKEGAITLIDGKPRIDDSLCIGCCDCVRACQSDALSVVGSDCEVTIGGKLGRHPRLAQSIGKFETADEVGDCLRRVIELLLSEGRKGERLGALLERLSREDEAGS